MSKIIKERGDVLKFKRFLSVILAVMMLVTSVAVIADETVTEEQTQQPAIMQAVRRKHRIFVVFFIL